MSKPLVLILGGYGGFGARLARRLAGDGWQVLVGGRNLAKARAFATTLPAGEGISADRGSDLVPLLEQHRPLLLVDAAGPFQGSSYRVVEACLAAGVHYIDLADGRDFVCQINQFDAAARQAGLAVIGGGSSVPALSGTVVRELAAGMERVVAVDMAISATTRASSGRSVVAAALSYAGKPIRLWRAGQQVEAHGWSLMRREHFAVDGVAPLGRLVGLAEVPDLELMPNQLPGKPAVTFRGGSESGLQMRALGMLSWTAARGWLQRPARLAALLAPLQQASARLGGTRSAMNVDVIGLAKGAPLHRRWTLIAEQGLGQEIPTLAAQLLARRLRAGALVPGARDASRELALADFQPLLAELPLSQQVRERKVEPLYQRLLGERFAAMSAPLRAMHAPLAETSAQGEARVERGRNPLARLLGWIMGFPPAGHYPLDVRFSPEAGTERWTRTFGSYRFSSEMAASRDGLLIERFGPLRFTFRIVIDGEGALQLDLARWSAFHLPMPGFLAPKIAAREWDAGGRFGFDVGVTMPLIGPVVHYVGTLTLENSGLVLG